MSDIEKFRLLLKHYIEHSKEHTDKYLEWAEKLKKDRPDVSKILYEAVSKFKEGEELLKKAYEAL